MPPYGEKRTHHVHVVEIDGKFWQRHLFRDYLRVHPLEAQRYETLKRVLAERFRDDREAYTRGKSDFSREAGEPKEQIRDESNSVLKRCAR